MSIFMHCWHCVQLNAGWEADVDVGPMISREAKARAEKLIQKGVEQGAQVRQP
jgi:malonate-semialdehyde dehydrogenase (acetylating)/methylmalonate-semialdehyde dehydrogenase